MNKPTQIHLSGISSANEFVTISEDSQYEPPTVTSIEMLITIKGFYCGGALITSDALVSYMADTFTAWQATFVDGDLAGQSRRVLRSRATGAIALDWERGLRWVRHDSEDYATLSQAMTDNLSQSLARYADKKLLMDLTYSPIMQSLLMSHPLPPPKRGLRQRIADRWFGLRYALAHSICPEAFEDEDEY